MNISQNDLSYKEFSKLHRLALGEKVSSKCVIYLDQKYWNILRDVKYNHRSNPIEIKLYNMLLELVRSGKAICPISFPVFKETMHQSDKESRLRTALTIDEFCGNVTIQPPMALDACYQLSDR